MAPTKAIATYAVTTLSLLTKGPKEAIRKSPWFTSLPAVTRKVANGSRSKKAGLLHYREISAANPGRRG
jgi:hypothetical protein